MADLGTSQWSAINLPSCHRVQEIRERKSRCSDKVIEIFLFCVCFYYKNTLNYSAKIFVHKDVGRDSYSMREDA